MPEQAADEGLAFVETAIDGKLVNTGMRHRLEVLALIVGHAGFRVNHHHHGFFAMLECLDGRQPGIAIGGADHHGAAIMFAQEVLHQPSLELSGKILRGTGRAMEQFQDPFVAIHLMQRRQGAMAELAAGLLENALEIRLGNRLAHERAHHPIGQFVVGQGRPVGNLLGFEQRQFQRHEQPAVRGHAR